MKVFLLTNSARMGKKMVAVAVLLAISVNAAVITHRMSARTSGSKSPNDVKTFPISAERPDFYKVIIEKTCFLWLKIVLKVCCFI